jgi:hypothetical protein
MYCIPPLVYIYYVPSLSITYTSLVSTIGYTFWLRLGWRFFLACLWAVLGDCLAVGALVATIMW